MTKPTAVFRFYWCISEKFGSMAFFDILDPEGALGVGYDHSTVTIQTLKKHGIEVPKYPSLLMWHIKQWLHKVFKGGCK